MKPAAPVTRTVPVEVGAIEADVIVITFGQKSRSGTAGT
jgi:hypothetical protein